MKIKYNGHHIFEIYQGVNQKKSDPPRTDVLDTIESLKAVSSIPTLKKIRFLDLKISTVRNRTIYSVAICRSHRLEFDLEKKGSGEEFINVTGMKTTTIPIQSKK